MAHGECGMATNEVTIVICYQTGTADLLRICLDSIQRHTRVPHKIVVLTKAERSKDSNSLTDLNSVLDSYPHVDGFLPIVDDSVEISSKIHGVLLDFYIPERVRTEYVLTLDSDCFPVEDGWLSDLFGMMDNGAKLVGILHPWAPPPDGLSHSKIEWRVRSQHCWEMTHVACQMIRVEDLRALGKRYNEGDDTGLSIPLEAKKRGWKIDGFKPTRCPRTETAYFEPEFNRYIGLVFGDKVYHQGGGTRTSVCGDEVMLEQTFGWVREMVKMEDGAEFLLKDEMSYCFEFDREEEIAAEKMQRLFGLKSQRMEG